MFIFVNVNPLGKKELDCVCRAISRATRKDYYEIEDKLELTADLFDCESLCVCCYKFLLDYVFKFPRLEEFKGMPIYEFLKHNKEEYIIRVDGHLTFARNGQIEDIWDCSNEIIDIIWVVC